MLLITSPRKGKSAFMGCLFLLLGLASGYVINPYLDSELLPENVVDELLDLITCINKILAIIFQDKGRKISHQNQQLYPVENSIWRTPKDLGQITGVGVDPAGNPVIFHRADRTWDYGSFDDTFKFRETFKGPINQDTVLTLNPKSGSVESSWGSNMFYLPHGLHIDARGNVWLTDVALHQVFKFTPGSTNPDLILGEALTPGSDNDHFCQPTSVAIANTGEIVVADGYCNNRIIVLDPFGNIINIIPRPGEFVALRVPHALTILEQGDVCVADRENMRVICMSLREGFPPDNEQDKRGPPLTLHAPDLGRVFAVASHGNTLYAVNGPTSPMIPVRGFIMDPNSETVFGHWAPTSGMFTQPHAMAISPNATELYVTEIGPNRIWKFDLVKNSLHQETPLE
ncbi:Similar to Pal2: Peptidyl-alpha-hydroxyglycine alpha-amidating lyase 2 (Drosophila melanogaster) [Cotesia congregata]|uniref:Similar to Pal2: Peptidyl-alpha-hydroxyglycine alpha-amidating lyase 2 (Drosophila melanogaster) n=1 Tax=Cotesia congregata TaxID=51543 RepID=A0A8J2HIU1_COTCN|nr:Similar to Pal2: Peptidyl-alpha-hydroxyglycine alpha-amidating lyase 2 (Drosophila melanogaster) [Cotesia congregata]